MINPLWLRTFCTLIDVGHFTRTAERLHMTQSGVSQHIRKLEEQLGTELLVRRGKQFSLSGSGETLYKEGHSILFALSNLESTVGNDPAFEGEVSVMSPGSVGLKLYPHLLALQCEHPKLIIDYRFAPNKDVEKAIIESKIDIGLMTSKPNVADISCTHLAQEPLRLVTPAAITETGWDILMNLGFIDHPDGEHHANLLLGANYPEFHHSDMFPKKGFSNQVSLILEPVSMGLGFTVLPAYAVEAFAKSDQINVHSLSKSISETLYLCVNRHRPLQMKTKTVIAEAKRWLEHK